MYDSDICKRGDLILGKRSSTQQVLYDIKDRFTESGIRRNASFWALSLGFSHQASGPRKAVIFTILSMKWLNFCLFRLIWCYWPHTVECKRALSIVDNDGEYR